MKKLFLGLALLSTIGLKASWHVSQLNQSWNTTTTQPNQPQPETQITQPLTETARHTDPIKWLPHTAYIPARWKRDGDLELTNKSYSTKNLPDTTNKKTNTVFFDVKPGHAVLLGPLVQQASGPGGANYIYSVSNGDLNIVTAPGMSVHGLYALIDSKTPQVNSVKVYAQKPNQKPVLYKTIIIKRTQ